MMNNTDNLRKEIRGLWKANKEIMDEIRKLWGAHKAIMDEIESLECQLAIELEKAENEKLECKARKGW